MVGDVVESIRSYYRTSPGYLSGPLQGTCHFGYTSEGQEFNLNSDFRAMELLLAKKLDLPAGSIVFDGGCGFGRVATRLALESGLRVIGADLTFERLQEANRFTTARGVSNDVKLLNANYCQIPLSNASVDGVFTMETLVHADPLEAALSEFKRVLRPGGKLAIFEYSAPRRESLDPMRKLLTDVMIKRTGMASMNSFYHGAFHGILQRAGFEHVQAEEISKNVYPTWEWLFWRSIHHNWLNTIINGESGDFTNAIASLFIWPYRHQLGYNIVTATKPLE